MLNLFLWWENRQTFDSKNNRTKFEANRISNSAEETSLHKKSSWKHSHLKCSGLSQSRYWVFRVKRFLKKTDNSSSSTDKYLSTGPLEHGAARGSSAPPCPHPTPEFLCQCALSFEEPLKCTWKSIIYTSKFKKNTLSIGFYQVENIKSETLNRNFNGIKDVLGPIDD